MKLKWKFQRLDLLSEEVAAVLSKEPMAFPELYDLVYAKLRSKGSAKTASDMLRLRVHEQLRKLQTAGIITKKDKQYTGVPDALDTFLKTIVESNSKFGARPKP